MPQARKSNYKFDFLEKAGFIARLFFYKKKTNTFVFVFFEATLRLELRNEAFAEPSLTNLGTSPSLPSIIRIFFRFYKTPMLKEKLKTHLLSRVLCFWLQSLRIDIQTPVDFKLGVLALWHQDLLACAAAFKNKLQ